MKKKTKDQIQNALLLATALGILGWTGSQLLDVTPAKTMAEENRGAIQDLIDLHLKK